MDVNLYRNRITAPRPRSPREANDGQFHHCDAQDRHIMGMIRRKTALFGPHKADLPFSYRSNENGA
jgi:hypothetical protein